MGGSLLQAYGSLAAGNAANKQSKENARLDLQDAANLLNETQERAAIIRRQGKRDASRVRANTAGSGFTQEGTSLQLELEQIRQSDINAMEEVRVGRTEERRLQSSALNNLRRGRVAKRSGQIGAFTALADGASKATTAGARG